jgi:23S rRNA (uracil1939-C5)-methyltransferase
MPSLELTIESLAKTGEGLARIQGRTVFVDGALPTEQVIAEVDVTQRVLRARSFELMVPSAHRRTPPCSLTLQCGGCPWMHLDYEQQLLAKRDIVWSALEHIGGVVRETVRDCGVVKSPTEFRSRRRATFHNHKGNLSFNARGSHHLVEVQACEALTSPLVQLPAQLSRALDDIKKDWSEIQLLESEGRVSILIALKALVKEKHRALCRQLCEQHIVRGVILSSLNPQSPNEFFGEVTFEEGGVFVAPDSFSQANIAVNRTLVTAALTASGVAAIDNVIELYSGNGNFTVALAERAKSVVAIESSRASVSLAQKALSKGKIDNVRLFESNAEKAMTGLIAESARFDVLLLDPPRAGAPQVAVWANALLVRRVVYVSCDPTSLARDAQRLVSAGFSLRSIELFDLFPQTPHVETLACFERET